MRTDRELLEDAAKAVGWVVVRWTDDGTALLLEGVQEPWNALHNNPHSDHMGDALGLAIALDLRVQPMKSLQMTQVSAAGHWTGELWGDSPTSATCRAIVRAAAKIGSSMP